MPELGGDDRLQRRGVLGNTLWPARARNHRGHGRVGQRELQRLSLIHISADHRSPLLPDTPTTAEQGFAQINITHWGGMYAPKGTPPDLIKAMNQAIADVMATPKVRQQLVDAGYEAIPGSVEKFGSFIAAEDKRLGAIVKSANMKAE